jgi:predicted transcriptional regulator
VDGSADLDAVAQLLEDGCVQTTLRETLEEPMSAPELTEMCEPLRATVYRRVDDRSDHGLLAERTAPDAEGHHRTVYVATLDSVEIELTPGGFEVVVSRRDRAADRFTTFVEGLHD